MEKVCVIGLGYIGLPTAAMLAASGLQVCGVDINDQIVNILNRGEIHIQEPGLRELVADVLHSGRFSVVNRPQLADAFVIAVPTPFYSDKTADMRAVISATESIVPHLRPGNLVILESTSPPRTTINLVQRILERSGLLAGEDFYLVYSPERVLPGKILRELVENARVIGGINQSSSEVGRDLYARFVKGEIILTDATTAEMVKLMENTYRDVNIAIANEFCRLADCFGIDVWEAIDIANRHPRVKILSPGPGVGGHCIGVDPWFLVESAPDITRLIITARQVNDYQPYYVVDRLEKSIGDLTGRNIAVLGLAYKPEVDDLRESPAVEIANLLSSKGAAVTAFEPFKPDALFDGFQTAPDIETALLRADVVLLLVGHQVFRNLLPGDLLQKTPARIIFDVVNGWQSEAWQECGFRVHRLGSGEYLTEVSRFSVDEMAGAN